MIDMLLTIGLFLIVLGVLVCIHEFGHFIAAKWSGVRVDEFGFGFPPRIMGVTWRGTLYSLNSIPLGGFVRIKGIAGEQIEEVDPTKHESTAHRLHDADSFASLSFLRKLLILFAGIGMNILLAWILFSLSFLIGVKAPVDSSYGKAFTSPIEVIVTTVRPDTPAARAGLQVGDTLLTRNAQTIDEIQDIQGFQAADTGKSIELEIASNNTKKTITIAPENIQLDSGETYVGIGVGLAAIQTIQYPPHLAVWNGAKETAQSIAAIFIGFGEIFSRIFTSESVTQDLAGPVGIAKITRGAADLGLSSLLQFMALLSANLAVFNLLPIPALDGGRIALTIITKIRRKPVSEKIETIIHSIGFVLLMLLVVAVTFQDILKIAQ
jgi:regulator of sigma E protease